MGGRVRSRAGREEEKISKEREEGEEKVRR